MRIFPNSWLLIYLYFTLRWCLFFGFDWCQTKKKNKTSTLFPLCEKTSKWCKRLNAPPIPSVTTLQQHFLVKAVHNILDLHYVSLGKYFQSHTRIQTVNGENLWEAELDSLQPNWATQLIKALPLSTLHINSVCIHIQSKPWGSDWESIVHMFDGVNSSMPHCGEIGVSPDGRGLPRVRLFLLRTSDTLSVQGRRQLFRFTLKSSTWKPNS